MGAPLSDPFAAPFDLAAPSFPPLLRGRIVTPGFDPFEAAVEAARLGEEAGALFWSAEPDLMRAAVVLAPDAPRAEALEMHLAAAVALNDALGALAPAETAVMHLWPDALLVNGAIAGAVRTAVAPGAADAAPDWMATGVALSLRFPHGLAPGDAPRFTALSEEGCGDLTATQLIEGWSRHFLAWAHRWETDGPRPLFDAWLHRAAGRIDYAEFEVAGEALRARLLGLGPGGDATLRVGQATRTAPLEAALARPRAWPPAAFLRVSGEGAR